MAKDIFRRMVLYPLEALALLLVFIVFHLMPLSWASAIGGFVGRTIGPRLGISRRADQNIRRAMPELDDPAVHALVCAMWDNLGRTVCEYPLMGRFTFQGPRSNGEIVGAHIIDRLRDDGKPAILFGGHLANWEIAASAFAERGVVLDRVYRIANNPLVEHLYRLGRGGIKGDQIPKGRGGAKALIKAIRDGHHIAMLLDQKMNDGISVPFFGIEAMTASAGAELAIKNDCPLVPVRTERIKGTQFKITVMEPLTIAKTGNVQDDARIVMIEVNRLLENWIRERPGQWLWLHNRWPNE